MSFKEKINKNPKIKKLIHRLLVPQNEARPRLWVRWFINPFIHKKGRYAKIRRRTRIDVLPFNDFSLGAYSIIEDFCTINNGVGAVYIGRNSLIGMGNVIIGPVIIGNDVIFAQNIVASGLNHVYQDIHTPIHQQGVTMATITVEDECWIGANVVLTAGITVGKHSVIAAGSIVTKDIPPYSIAAGNPARIIKQYNQLSGTWDKTVP
jgi:acetyltransferase-like isoleucine patch superfamily enzyme